jgi:hypothetical protein
MQIILIRYKEGIKHRDTEFFYINIKYLGHAEPVEA